MRSARTPGVANDSCAMRSEDGGDRGGGARPVTFLRYNVSEFRLLDQARAEGDEAAVGAEEGGDVHASPVGGVPLLRRRPREGDEQDVRDRDEAAGLHGCDEGERCRSGVQLRGAWILSGMGAGRGGDVEM